MKVFKTVVASILMVAAVVVMVIGYPTPMTVAQSAANPWGLNALDCLNTFAEENKDLYDTRTDTINGWENGTIDHWQTLQEIDLKAPWEENSNEYYAEDSILGKTIKVYSPDATNQQENWSADKAYEVFVPATIEAKAWEDMTEEEQYNSKELAVALYYYANAKYVNAPCAGYYSVCFTDNVAAGGIHNRVNLDILEIRNNGEYYRQDYRLDGGIDLFKSMSFLEDTINAKLELKCAERRYCNKDMTKTLYYKSNNATTVEGIPTTNWNSKGSDPTDPNFYNPQPFTEKSGAIDSGFVQNKDGTFTEETYTPRGFQKCVHTIEYGFEGNNDTIKSAVITQNEWGGLSADIWLVTIKEQGITNYEEIAKRTTAYTARGIREGSKDSNANYALLNIKFDLWSNGMYRSYYQGEAWEAKAIGSIDITADFKYNDVFFYGEADCDLQKYINEWSEAKSFSDTYNA